MKCLTVFRRSVISVPFALISNTLLASPYPGTYGPAYGSPFTQAPQEQPSGFWSTIGHFLFSSDDGLVTRLLYVIAGALIGGLIGTFLSDRYRKFRGYVLLGLVGIFALLGIIAGNKIAFLVSALAAGIYMYYRFKDPVRFDDPIYGDAHPARYPEISAAGYAPAYDEATGQLGQAPSGVPLGFTI